MYKVLKNYLETAIYTTEDGLARIDYQVARGTITPEEAQELATIAQERGTPLTLESRVEALEQAQADMVRVETVPSDKVGYDWVNTYIAGVLVKQEYVEAQNPEGTQDNPIPWGPEVALRPNAWYSYEGETKVWMGPEGVTASWDDGGWEVMV